jgi:hypothetical protein
MEKMVVLEGWIKIKPLRMVQCSRADCPHQTCSHLQTHFERINCYNKQPEMRVSFGSRSYVSCPGCKEV